MNRTISFAPDEWYHCYNRGVDKREIFLMQSDYQRFLALLYTANSIENPVRLDNLKRQAFEQGQTLLEIGMSLEQIDPLVDIGAYSLMPNHFHLALRERVAGGVTMFMRKIGTGYTMYFNKKNDRTGSLFGNAFRARHVDTDPYLKRLINYIHANAAELVEPKWKEGVIRNRKKTEEFLKQYSYASLPDYLGIKRLENKLIAREVFELFETVPDLNNLFEDAETFAQEETQDFRL